ncbi:MAG: molybdopterin-dependent oxidoreductase [Bacteroidales bacterium]|nr:molybdopterin-dependent oxidoreductase [Bacteroidales bacterium]
MSQYITIQLNGKTVQGIQGETIYECATRHGISIPTLCHDPRVEPFSSCYVCVVEVQGMRGHQPSCSTYLTPGMEINTESEAVKKSRKTALDLLLSNHYADCMAPCKQTCPAGVDVQGYISLIDKGRYSDAVALIKETNPLPAICGRVCVRPCEVACRRGLMEEGAAVGIDYLKRFAADYDLASPNKFIPAIKPETGKRVAVIGAGPGGLSTAYYLRLEGHQVDIFESAPHAGGWLRYGIPEYRLPNDLLDQEVKNITDLGVKIHYRKTLGVNLSYQDIANEYHATVLTIGSQKGTSVGCPGDDAENVFSGIDFLKNMEMTNQRYDFSGKTVVVVGGGNTAMDCCRTSVRCGAEKVYVVYRRTEKEMPANPIEIHESKLEGVEYLFLTNPVEILKDNDGKLDSVRLIRMELGEPDASGRRRPMPKPGSEFDLKADYILAAIGQKTDVNFIVDINSHATDGKLVLTKWGDIDANKLSLQTGIPSVFAAGDGVTGPATIIEAIAQAKIAARSCHQFMMGEALEPPKKEFLSKKDNFREQLPPEYKHRFPHQKRQEMPVLPAEARSNFEEVELGYKDELTAIMEAGRCLECGCNEYYTCDLKKHSTYYQAEQKAFEGEFHAYDIDHRHPFIEIDNNKCILCSRCIRICREVVGANALGLINRGFKSYVAPAMGLPLQETSCESCGLCITTCPTGAITENFPFKPGPLKLETIKSIDMFGSEGYEVNLMHHRGQFYKAEPRQGDINKMGIISRRQMFGYNLFNRKDRINTPLLKQSDGSFAPISFDEAYEIIATHIKQVKPDQNAFFGGARMTNEELYLIQKLARAAVKTNNVSSFHYMGRGDGYFRNSNENAPFCDLRGASKIYVAGGELHLEHPVINHLIYNTKHKENIEVVHITSLPDSRFSQKADRVIHIGNYFYFIKAANHFLLHNGLENSLFIKDRTQDFDAYKNELLACDFNRLLEWAGTDEATVAAFAREYNEEMNAIMVFQEKELSSNASMAIHNLAMITGKLGKSANGIISLKEKSNAHGIFDMGLCHKIGVGAEPILDDDLQYRMAQKWGVKDLPFAINSVYKLITGGRVQNVFIFGEDPVGCALNKPEVNQWFDRLEFVVVQDYILTDTAKRANLVMPASFPWETGGSFTNSQRRIQQIDKQISGPVSEDGFMQLVKLLGHFGLNGINSPAEALNEAMSLLPKRGDYKELQFVYKDKDNANRQFDHGCDVLNKLIDEDFEEKLGW